VPIQQSATPQIMKENRQILCAYSQYLNYNPRFLTAEMVTSLAMDCQIDTHEAFVNLFSAACGLDTSLPAHRTLERLYIRKGVARLDPAVYLRDPYTLAVSFPKQKMGKWELCHKSYAPYEPFAAGDPILTSDFREIPRLGYFEEAFSFPAVLENGVEWMTVTPNEIETMKVPIQNSHGRVLTLGLGLGYFAFHAAQKENVERVTVVERDPDVIQLFRQFLLPQFPNKEKIEIIEADALALMAQKDVAKHYDSIFADLWHDPSDGLPLYLQLRRIEKEKQLASVDYWIEASLLSTLRGMVWDRLQDGSSPLKLTNVKESELLSDAFLKTLAADMKAAQP